MQAGGFRRSWLWLQGAAGDLSSPAVNRIRVFRDVLQRRPQPLNLGIQRSLTRLSPVLANGHPFRSARSRSTMPVMAAQGATSSIAKLVDDFVNCSLLGVFRATVQHPSIRSLASTAVQVWIVQRRPAAARFRHWPRAICGKTAGVLRRSSQRHLTAEQHDCQQRSAGDAEQYPAKCRRPLRDHSSPPFNGAIHPSFVRAVAIGRKASALIDTSMLTSDASALCNDLDIRSSFFSMASPGSTHTIRQ